MPKINYAKLFTQRSDGRYQTKYKDAQGKWHSICDKDPQRLYERVELLTSPTYKTFATVADEWETVHRAEIGDKTWVNYKPHVADIVKEHGKRPIDEISALDIIKDLRVAQTNGCSATIIRTRRSIYRMILDHALVCGYIKYNPAVGVKMPKGVEIKRREAPAEDIVTKILQTPDAPFALFPILLVCTGLRKAEALALTWADITDTHINVDKALDYAIHAHPVVKSPKTKAGVRRVPMPAALRKMLVKPKRAKETDLVFPAPASNRSGDGGGHMTERQYEGAWNRYCAHMGFVDEKGKPTVTAHQLRHGTATLLFESGVDELTAQAVLGHASPTTTRDIYTHLREKHKETMVSKFDAMISDLVANDS